MKKMISKKAKILWAVFTPITAFLLAFAILCIVTMCMYSPTFLGRVLSHWDSKITDYKIFPERTIQKSETPYVYERNINGEIGNIKLTHSKKQKTLSEFVKTSDTTSLLIVKNDELVYEQYANGYKANSINTSFSMSKSVTSLLIGKAIEKGYIQSVNEPISNYIKEFKNLEIGKTTIEELLLMRSKIVFNDNKPLWFGDDTLTYWYDNLRELALSHTKTTNKYNGKFVYNEYHPLLLGIILERCTGQSVSKFFEQEFWQKIGAENDASWSLDSKKHGFEKMESGINFRSIDFIKLGSMVLHNGFWNGQQIIIEEWLKTSTLCEFPIDNKEYEDSFLDGKNAGYKYMWYTTPCEQSGFDVLAWGKSDQILYISPANNTVILRTGKTDGGVSNWLPILKKIITNII